MKLKLLSFVSLVYLLFMGSNLTGQVTSVNYQLKYDTASCSYQCLAIIIGGSTTNLDTLGRKIGNANFSLVLNTGDSVYVDTSVWPKSIDETTSTDWHVSTKIYHPAAMPDKDFWSFVPTLGDFYYKGGLLPGDTVHLFSVKKVGTTTQCGEDIRLFINGSDPNSSAAGMNGTAFTQGFTIGNAIQRYNTNSTQIPAPSDFIIGADLACSTGIEIDLSVTPVGTCQGPLSYSWTGPSSYSGTSQDVLISPATNANNGTYYVTVSDAIGCSDTLSVIATSKPSAGPDTTICAGNMVTITGSPTTGSWTAVVGNPAGATLTPIGSGTSKVTIAATAANGTYKYKYSLSTTCTDTMSIIVRALPTITMPTTSACVGDVVTNLTPTSGGVWTSSNSGIASINSTSGAVTAVSPGTAKFTYTRTLTGCSSTTANFTVNSNPTLVLPQDSTCVGGVLNASPTFGGTWVASNGVLTINNAGHIVGISQGLDTITFTETATGCHNDTIVKISGRPVVSITGNDSICIGSTTQLSPNSGGTWTSSGAGYYASADNTGLVTGNHAGKAVFVYTSNATGCISDPTDSITVNPNPIVSLDDNRICIGTTVQANANGVGTWVSGNSNANIDNAGVVTALHEGPVIFTFTNAATTCSSQTGILTIDPKPAADVAQDTICLNSSTNLIPVLTGTNTWTNLTPTILNMTGGSNKLVTGIDTGTAKLIYLDNVIGCYSDTVYLKVVPKPQVSILGDPFICALTTAQLSSNGEAGFWTSSDANVATVTTDGLVTGLIPGTVTFKFTSTSSLCMSDPTGDLEIYPIPVVTIPDNELCIGDSIALLSSVSGGTWSSTNSTVASINPSTGMVTAKAAGIAKFIFTDDVLGCPSEATGPITVGERPIVSNAGDDVICIGGNTQLNASTVGTWAVSSGSGATINNAGTVTGLTAGNTCFVFTQTNNACPSDPLCVTIAPTPVVSITGDSAICIGATTTLASTVTGGSWSASAGGYTTVDAAGVVTGVSAGSTFFTFISDDGCPSPQSHAVVVNGPTTVTIPPGDMCIGDTKTLSPATGGIWASSVDTIASITTNILTAVNPGTVSLTFTDTITGCITNPTTTVKVNVKPPVTLSDNDLCVGQTAQLFPNSGGVWTTSNDTVAAVGSSAIVTAEKAGTVTFQFTDLTTGCISNPTAALSVTDGTPVSLTGDNNLCIGETTTFEPSTGGTWVPIGASNTVATITNGGVVTAIGPGIATFEFTDALGCKTKTNSTPIVVNPKPTVTLNGSDFICIGATTDFNASGTGTWESTDTLVATITSPSGTVTGVAEGTAQFIFTQNGTGCKADTSAVITVGTGRPVSITGPTEICVSEKTQLSEIGTGVWASNDITVATVDNNGVVTSVGPGTVTFTFTDALSGCANGSVTDTLTVTNCANPDFNVTYVNIPVDGDVSTNDQVSGSTTYSTPELNTKPSGSVANITVNSDGTYTFTADKVGVYKYYVPVCAGTQTIGCPKIDLWITVLDHTEPIKRPVANVDFATTFIDVDVTLPSLANDDCVVVTSCNLDPASVTVVTTPKHGTATPNSSNGDITYNPDVTFTGFDTLVYQVCVVAEPTNCATAKQIILVTSPTALNSTVADDDFVSTAEGVAVSGNVMDNDSDPEGDDQAVVPQSISGSPAGDLTLLADGSFVFTPAEYFTGPYDFPYHTCDDQIPAACADATLHVLVVPDLEIKVRVYLEGALMENAGAVAQDGRPLMRDNLRSSVYENGVRYMPNKDPYKFAPSEYIDIQGTELSTYFSAVVPGGTANQTRFDSVRTPTVFDVTGQNALVDWVFVELRSKLDSTAVISTRSGIVQRDGDVVDMDGFSGLKFPGLAMDNYFVVVRHRSHLGAMTKFAQTPKQLVDLVDFTKAALPLWDYGTTISGFNFAGLSENDAVVFGYKALWAGDADMNGKVKYDSPGDDLNSLFFDVLSHPNNVGFNANYDFAYGYLPGDFNLNGKSKFDNPDDDKNMLFFQVLNYPLNTSFQTNFDFVIEQVPH